MCHCLAFIAFGNLLPAFAVVTHNLASIYSFSQTKVSSLRRHWFSYISGQFLFDELFSLFTLHNHYAVDSNHSCVASFRFVFAFISILVSFSFALGIIHSFHWPQQMSKRERFQFTSHAHAHDFIAYYFIRVCACLFFNSIV